MKNKRRIEEIKELIDSKRSGECPIQGCPILGCRAAGLVHQSARQQMAVAAACARRLYFTPTATWPASARPAGRAVCWLTWVGTPAAPLAAGRNKGSSEQQALKSKLAEMRTQFQQLLVSAAPTPCTAASACSCS